MGALQGTVEQVFFGIFEKNQKEMFLKNIQTIASLMASVAVVINCFSSTEETTLKENQMELEKGSMEAVC